MKLEYKMSRKNVLLAIAIVLFFCVVQNFAQQTGEAARAIVKDDANACEINSSNVHTIKIEALNTNEKIFIIFRAGNGESTKANLRRFTIVRKFLQKNKGWTDGKRYIFSRGKRAEGEGRVEFYLGTRFVWASLAKRGKIPCMDCCGYDFNRGIF